MSNTIKQPQPTVESESPDTISDQMESTPPVEEPKVKASLFDDLDALKVSQDFASTVGVKRVLTTVPCRKPHSQEFVRVRPGEEWRLEVGIFTDKSTREHYIVLPNLCDELLGEVKPTCLFLATTRRDDAFIWPVKLPDSNGRSNSWNESSLKAARLAETEWTKVTSNMEGGFYNTEVAVAQLPDPKWPGESLQDLLKLCFKNRTIENLDHEVFKVLRGER